MDDWATRYDEDQDTAADMALRGETDPPAPDDDEDSPF